MHSIHADSTIHIPFNVHNTPYNYTDQSESILDRFFYLVRQKQVCINYILLGKNFIYQNNKHASDTMKAP